MSRLHFQGYLNTVLTVIMMVCVVIILANAAWRCTQVLRGRLPIPRTASWSANKKRSRRGDRQHLSESRKAASN